jgi:hypothetical protein
MGTSHFRKWHNAETRLRQAGPVSIRREFANFRQGKLWVGAAKTLREFALGPDGLVHTQNLRIKYKNFQVHAPFAPLFVMLSTTAGRI